MRLRTAIALLMAVTLIGGGLATAMGDQPLDPAHNVALPCESVSTPGLVPRSAKNIAHVANVCGFVGTDVEFQSRKDADGNVHDYAFVGTMGAGTRIFDITDPAHPTIAGGYADPGWQNDVHVRGDTLVLAFDPLVVGAHVSECLKAKQAGTASPFEGGFDAVRLHFDPETATFRTALTGCYLSTVPEGGAHTITLHPSGEWVAVNTSWEGVEVVDLRGPEPKLNRLIGRAIGGDAHDVSFSRDGNLMYAASPGGATASGAPTNVGGTYVVDVSRVLTEGARRISFIPENSQGGGSTNRYNLTTTHQSDVSADGKILVYTDERGGGLSQTACNTGPDGIIGGAHFYALAPIEGQSHTADASPSNPKRLGTWFYPNPMLLVDVLDEQLAKIGRTERACTIHVFRNGGNGSSGPGEIAPGFDGVSRLPADELVTAHYGAGVWHLDFSGPPKDKAAEDKYTNWGTTLGWNVMPGADTWSAKEYKGFIYAGDIARGFDVYSFANCSDVTCVVKATNTPGSANGGGRVSGELAELSILRGTSAGGKATFGFGVSYETGAVAPSGTLSFNDHAGKKVEATAIDSFTATGTKASFTGRATVNGVADVRFFVEVEDLGEPGSADTFRIVLGDGYGAGGVLLKGNIQVEAAPLLGLG